MIRPRAVLGLLIASIVALSTGEARADGIPAYLDTTGWHLLGERAQHAVVVLEGGKEHLLLQIALAPDLQQTQASRLVWVTPIPAPATSTHVHILRGMPTFYGSEPTGYLFSALRGGLALMALSQLWTVPIVSLGLMMRAGGMSGAPDVRVFESQLRDGVEVELLEADSVDALMDHLATRGLGLPPEARPSLSRYATPSHAFVVFRIADLAAYRAASAGGGRNPALGIEAVFPSDTGFFPLVASAALPGEQLEIVVTTPGFHEAVAPAPPGLWTGHYVGRMEAGAEVRESIRVPSDEIRYTRFRTSGAPRELTRDLRFAPGAPTDVRLAAAWMLHPAGTWIGLALLLVPFILLSFCAASVARLAWPAAARPGFKDAAWMGAANVLSIIGVYVMARRYGARHGLARKYAVLGTLVTSLVFSILLLFARLLLI